MGVATQVVAVFLIIVSLILFGVGVDHLFFLGPAQSTSFLQSRAISWAGVSMLLGLMGLSVSHSILINEELLWTAPLLLIAFVIYIYAIPIF